MTDPSEECRQIVATLRLAAHKAMSKAATAKANGDEQDSDNFLGGAVALGYYAEMFERGDHLQKEE